MKYILMSLKLYQTIVNLPTKGISRKAFYLVANTTCNKQQTIFVFHFHNLHATRQTGTEQVRRTAKPYHPISARVLVPHSFQISFQDAGLLVVVIISPTFRHLFFLGVNELNNTVGHNLHLRRSVLVEFCERIEMISKRKLVN